MIIAAEYSFIGGKELIRSEAPDLEQEIREVIGCVDALSCKTKLSKEKTKEGSLLFSPKCLNGLFKKEFESRGWSSIRVECAYQQDFYTQKFLEKTENNPIHVSSRPYREMDFVKCSKQSRVKVGVEVQFGKYSFMVYNVAAKMTIFRNLEIIDFGVEIVPVKKLADNMSTGVSFFEQLVWDLEHRGISNIDVPVWIIGLYI